MKTCCIHIQQRLVWNATTITVLVLLLAQGCAQTAGDLKKARALGPFTEWRHSGTIYIITTPEGADLPASTSEENFPLLVRLHKDFFDFSQAKANGWRRKGNRASMSN